MHEMDVHRLYVQNALIRKDFVMHDLVRDMRLVAFDLDGTLIDSVPDLAAALDAALGDQDMAPVGDSSAIKASRMFHSSGTVQSKA